VTVDEGIARGRDDPFALKRVRVNAGDTAVTLLRKLREASFKRPKQPT
jgi:hypothetical protein